MTGHSTPFRFGLVAVPQSRESWLDLARQAESLGFDSLLVPDNLRGTAAVVACTAAAAVTERLTVGPYVIATPLRTPGLVAADAAALHLMSDGRVEFGLGAGRPDAAGEAAELGLDFGSPAQRVAHLEQTLAAVRERTPATTLTVAASGPRMLALAGRMADVVALGAAPTATATDYARMGAVVHEAAADAGREVTLNLNLTAVGDQLPPWLEQRLGLRVDDLVAAGAAGVLRGSPDEMAQTLRTLRETTGVSYVCAGAHHAADLAPVVTLLRGS